MYNNKPYKIIFPLLLAAAVAIGLIIGRSIGRSSTESQIWRIVSRLNQPYHKIDRALSLIQTQYVDSIDMDSLSEDVIPMILSRLDPHSVYIPREQMNAVNDPLEGEFDGIGIMFNMTTDTILVLNVIPSGPSYKAGLQNGDRIIKINDSIVAGQKIPQEEIVKRLRGPRGSKVKLALKRQGLNELIDAVVQRDAIPINSLDAAFMIDDNIAYMRLSAFAKNSYAEIIRALASLRNQGMDRLILDLRGNSGGFLEQAILIANEFLPADCMIVYTENRRHERIEQFSTGTGSSTDIPLAILIDEESASSSEILAGALQDNDRGTIIGRRSFGKGLVQTQIPFDDGSAIRLTTARYYTPTGRSIQKPYTAGDEESYLNDLYNRYVHNEFFTADSIRFEDSLRYVTPKGHVVYGGGGIMPDIFVPMDTTDLTNYFLEVTRRNIVARYILDYTDRHRAELNSVRTLDGLNRLLGDGSQILDDFVAFAARNGVAPNYADIRRSRKLMTAQLKAYIGQNTPLDGVGFYANIYPVDNVITTAVDHLKNLDKEALQDD